MGMQGHAQTGVTDTITKGEHEWACKGMHRQRWACTQRVTHTQLRDDAITLLHSFYQGTAISYNVDRQVQLCNSIYHISNPTLCNLCNHKLLHQ